MERPEIVVLDTHAWVWWISDPNELSDRALEAVDRAAENSAIYVSAISAWELSLLVSRKRVQLTLDVSAWISRCEAVPFLHFVSVDNLIALKSNLLPNYLNRDPADRMIIATALTLNATIITKDRKILNYSGVKSKW